ncbi:hypothetical protein pb186bvf_012901 [Paramecium bursaria]
MIINFSQQDVELVMSLIQKFKRENEEIGKENLDLKEKIQILEKEVQSKRDAVQKSQMESLETTSLKSSDRSFSEQRQSSDQNSGTKITKKVNIQAQTIGSQVEGLEWIIYIMPKLPEEIPQQQRIEDPLKENSFQKEKTLD